MGHLGSRISALVDGQLAPAAAERALEHIAGCGHCRLEMRAERRARELMSHEADVAAPGDLTERLLALRSNARPADAPRVWVAPDAASRDSLVAETFRSPTSSLDVAGGTARESGGRRLGVSGRSPRRRQVLGAVAGVCLVTAAAGGVLFALGACPRVVPAHQALADYSAVAREGLDAVVGTVEAVGSAQDLAGSVVSEIDPQALPESLGVRQVAVSHPTPGQVEVIAVTDLGTVVLVQQEGILDTGSVAAASAVPVRGGYLRVVGSDPFLAVWQHGDTVVTLVADVPEQQVHEILQALDAAGHGLGFSERLERGLNALGAAVGAG